MTGNSLDQAINNIKRYEQCLDDLSGSAIEAESHKHEIHTMMYDTIYTIRNFSQESKFKENRVQHLYNICGERLVPVQGERG